MRLRHPDDYAYVVAQYDGEISQVDAQVGRLSATLKERGLWDNTIVVLLSDHGEAFGEGGLYFDHHGLYDAVTRIALMIRTPDHRAGRVDALVSTEDLLPTLCDLAGLPPPPYDLTGMSAAPAAGGDGARACATSGAGRIVAPGLAGLAHGALEADRADRGRRGRPAVARRLRAAAPSRSAAVRPGARPA